MVNLKLIYKIIGSLLFLLGSLLLICAGVSLYYKEDDLIAFLISAIFTICCGFVMKYFGSDEPMNTKEPTNVDSWDQPQGFGLTKLKTCPSGFPKDWPHVDYLRLKEYCCWHAVSTTFFEGDGWLDEMERMFRAAKPMMDFMNSVIDDYE